MQPDTRFALETHAGPYERWPQTSRLIVDGVRMDARVPGYVIDAQYRTPLGTLLVTSFDCVFEESSCFLLLDGTHRVLARRDLGTPYSSWLLDAHWPTGPTTLVLHYQVDAFFSLAIMPTRRLWPRCPRLRLRRGSHWRGEPRMVAAHQAFEARLREI